MCSPPPHCTAPPHSYLELYNEEITDLLASSGSASAAPQGAQAQGGLQIRDGDAHRRGIYVEGLSLHAAVNGAVGGAREGRGWGRTAPQRIAWACGQVA